MPKWTVTLTGEPRHLKTLARLDVDVSEECHAFVLRRPELDALPDARAVRERAIQLVDVLNGLGWQTDSEFRSVGVGPIRGDDGSHTISVSLGEVLVMGEQVEFRVTDATGKPIPPPPPPGLYAKAVGLALRDDAVRQALHFLAPPVHVGNLWKAFEVIREEVSEEEMAKGQWTTGTEIRRFRHTVNSPGALRDDARHGVEQSSPPSNPMSLPECQDFVKRLLMKWLDSK